MSGNVFLDIGVPNLEGRPPAYPKTWRIGCCGCTRRRPNREREAEHPRMPGMSDVSPLRRELTSLREEGVPDVSSSKHRVPDRPDDWRRSGNGASSDRGRTANAPDAADARSQHARLDR